MTEALPRGQVPAPDDVLRPSRTGAHGMTRFDDAYDQPDPRAYFRALRPWGYRTPHHAQSVFRRLLAARTAAGREQGPATVLDLCCSYGVNAALLQHDLTLEELYEHYASAGAAALTTTELEARDRSFYAARRRPDAVRVIGLDMAAHAIAYARSVGLLDEGFAENLEAAPPSRALVRAVRHTRLITVTGGASFLSARTFAPLLASIEVPVWVAAFVLRTGSYRAIARSLAAYGLVTEKLIAPTFPQRRFTDERERRYAVDAVTAAGEDPRGKESEGAFHTALYLSRPAAEVADVPLSALLGGGL
ncbi:hypothetical protein [Streptomyces melanogenes]|uniref:hypothetical protein n=1 Tax=Streptomyces melanogenes TaxID=67326 RepID=UPI0027E44A29|nr:hypothetical protein [Streptomyces melanogenes]